MEVVVKLNPIFAFLLDLFQKFIKTKITKWSIKRIDQILGKKVKILNESLLLMEIEKRQKSEVIRPWT